MGWIKDLTKGSSYFFYVATHWGRISAEIEEYRKRLQDQKGLEDEEKVGVIPHDDVRPDPDEVKPPKKEKGLFITEAIAMEREECAKIADRHDKTIGEAGRGERRFLDGVKQGRDPNSRKELPNSKATISG